MKLSDYIAEFLAEYGCTYVFGYQGGAVTHLVDSLYRRSDLRFIAACNEQGAAFAAEGYARVRNDIGVAVATSGPGATNLITGIGSAYFDSIPCLYLTGQV
ncbi:MAG: thiamine pyrophosphate-binding protein, partial [Ruminococcaceae bacterium]|nr:thiamine pyrophosphate-binding protein [Oscillospiraceae bacterium]